MPPHSTRLGAVPRPQAGGWYHARRGGATRPHGIHALARRRATARRHACTRSLCRARSGVSPGIFQSGDSTPTRRYSGYPYCNVSGVRMTPRIRLLVVMALLAALGLPVWAQEIPAAVFKSSVDLVSMAATVRDARGKIVSSLRRDDFEVFDAGQQRPVLDLRTESAAPASVALLVDGSGSMKLGLASDAALRISSAILGSLKPE